MFLEKLKSTAERRGAPAMLLYGVDGIGKTTLASEFPNPIYLPTSGERPPIGVDMATPGEITSLRELLDIIDEIMSTRDQHNFETVIVDSIDGMESLVWDATCQRIERSSIADAGYGKGYAEADEEWSTLIGIITLMAENGMNVVLIGHPDIVRHDSPLSDPYNRYTPKLHKRANALIRERVDIVAFMNYNISVREKKISKDTSVAHAEGGKARMVYFNEAPGFLAKNRYGMPDQMVWNRGSGYEEMSKYWLTR